MCIDEIKIPVTMKVIKIKTLPKIQIKNALSLIILSVKQAALNNPLECFSNIEGHVALDRNLGLGYNTLLLRLIPGEIFIVHIPIDSSTHY